LLIALTACAPAQTPAPAKAAATAKPTIPLTPFTASDQSASAGVPAGWTVTKSGNTAITMTGPRGETVFLGLTVVAHSGPFQPGQKAPAPASISMPYSASLPQKLAMMNQQGAALGGYPDPKVVGVSQTPVRKSPVLGQCGEFVFTFNGKTPEGPIAPLKAMTFICSLPMDAAGLYKNIMIQAQAPVATAAQSAPTALAIFASYKIPPAWLQKLIAPMLQPQDLAAINQHAQQVLSALAPMRSAAAGSQDLKAAQTSMGETNYAIQGADRSSNCADANIRETPTIFLPQSCGGPWADGFAPQ
jgi:hypothetical protein